jgi:hypothetical protein
MNGRERGPRFCTGQQERNGRLRPCATREAEEAGCARGPREGEAKLLERADMSGVSSNFVKKFVRDS